MNKVIAIAVLAIVSALSFSGVIQAQEPSPTAEPTTGTIIIDKDTDPERNNVCFSFDFDPGSDISCLEDDDDPVEKANLSPRKYTLFEEAKAGWELTDIDCDGGSNVDIDEVTNVVSINLKAGETVTCVFNNVEIPPTPVPTAVGTQIPPPIQDACNNIEGIQTRVPEGLKLEDGSCKIPAVDKPAIKPPSTGDAGLK